MKNVLKLFFAVVPAILILVLAGCALTGSAIVPIQPCGDPSQSIIHKVVADSKRADLILNLVNYEGLDRGLYTKKQAEEFFDKIEWLVDNATTYADLALFVTSEVEFLKEKLGGRFIVISSYLASFVNQDIPVVDYDRCWIKKQVVSQRSKVLSLFK